MVASTIVEGKAKRSEDLRIVSDVAFMPDECTNTKGYTFEWTGQSSNLEPVLFNAEINKADTTKLFVPALSPLLNADIIYTIWFDVRLAGDPEKVSARSATTVTVTAADLEPVISGGNVRLASYQNFTLDASASRDPDASEAHEMEYVWTCAAYDANTAVVKPTGRFTGPLTPQFKPPSLVFLFLSSLTTDARPYRAHVGVYTAVKSLAYALSRAKHT